MTVRAEPEPSAVSRDLPVFGFSQPSWPECCAVYQTPPSPAGATSWMRARRHGVLPHRELGVSRGRRVRRCDARGYEQDRSSPGRACLSVRDGAAAGLGRVALLVGAIRRAHERPREDGAEPERLALFPEPAELVGMHPAVDHGVLR